MASESVGNPNVSLLPQPDVPAPIQAMRGGGSEDVSLLPQPSQPVPIEPMRGGGGGGEDVSLLPQPDQPAPIVPMRGGARFPVLELKQFKRAEAKQLEPPGITIDFFRAYQADRKEKWGEKIPKDFQESKAASLNVSLPPESLISIFFVYSYEHFEQILTRFSKDDQKKTTIFLCKTTMAGETAKIYKKLITLFSQTEKPRYFLLFDKNQDINKIAWKFDNSASTRKSFLYLEPTSITLPYKVDGTEKKLIISSSASYVPELDKDSVAIVSREEGTELIGFPKDDTKKRTIAIPTLKPGVIYSIDTKGNQEFWNSEYLILDFQEGDLPSAPAAPPTASEEEKEMKDKVEADKKAEEAAASAEPPVSPPVIVKVVLLKRDITPIQVGSHSFELRKPTEEVLNSWASSQFTESEKAFLGTIGLTEPFFTENLSTRKQILLKKLPAFLESLVISRCYKDMTLLLRSECEDARNFLRELYELKQLDRLSKMSVSLKELTQFEFEIPKYYEEKQVFNVLLLIAGLLPIGKEEGQIYYIPLNLEFGNSAGPVISAAAASASAAAATATAPAPQERPPILRIFGRRSEEESPIFRYFGRRLH